MLQKQLERDGSRLPLRSRNGISLNYLGFVVRRTFPAKCSLNVSLSHLTNLGLEGLNSDMVEFIPLLFLGLQIAHPFFLLGRILGFLVRAEFVRQIDLLLSYQYLESHITLLSVQACWTIQDLSLIEI